MDDEVKEALYYICLLLSIIISFFMLMAGIKRAGINIFDLFL